MILRKDVEKFIDAQFKALDGQGHHSLFENNRKNHYNSEMKAGNHYGRIELMQLLDNIYESATATTSSKDLQEVIDYLRAIKKKTWDTEEILKLDNFILILALVQINYDMLAEAYREDSSKLDKIKEITKGRL